MNWLIAIPNSPKPVRKCKNPGSELSEERHILKAQEGKCKVSQPFRANRSPNEGYTLLTAARLLAVPAVRRPLAASPMRDA